MVYGETFLRLQSKIKICSSNPTTMLLIGHIVVSQVKPYLSYGRRFYSSYAKTDQLQYRLLVFYLIL